MGRALTGGSFKGIAGIATCAGELGDDEAELEFLEPCTGVGGLSIQGFSFGVFGVVY